MAEKQTNLGIQIKDKTHLAEIPLSLQYLMLLDPTLTNPNIMEKGGMGRILFYLADGQQPTIGVYRSIARYLDGNLGVQDEIHLRSANEGVQFNFEFDKVGAPIKFPKLESSNFPLLQKTLTEIREMARQKGSVILSDSGFRAESDGEKWIVKTINGKSAPSLPPGFIGIAA
jgi:hypothetical protein